MILKIFNFLIGFVFGIIGFFIDLLLSILPSSLTPDLTSVSTIIVKFWDYIFGWFNWVRDALMIDSLSINLIVDILTITFLYKPIISITKIFINWLKELF